MENKIIANTYEIIGQIGAGGGGVIYLAQHLRLDKKVVLKADKRSIHTDMATLRSEVDALKNLSHTYIPKVYDFIIEDNVVYTAMDYIDGNSFDKYLKNGTVFSSADITKWACQLLEALVYLHSRPPKGILHADIKPANIMLTNSGDISLIDFNIALVLGEEGAVAVGRSFGYASPEHYGEAYVSQKDAKDVDTSYDENITVVDDAKTQLGSLEDLITVLDSEDSDADSVSSHSHSVSISTPSGSYAYSTSKMITLDVRSDVYSLGATLYHLISGKRPAKRASDVVPLVRPDFPKAILDIITKATNPDINLRYQTAEDMLADFRALRKKDARAKAYNRMKIAMATVALATYAVGGSMLFTGLSLMEEESNMELMATQSQSALSIGNVDMAIDLAVQSMPNDESLIKLDTLAISELALSDALGVYDLSDGFKEYKVLTLDGAPMYMEMSPSGNTAAIIANYELHIVDLETLEILGTFETLESALCEAHYIDEEKVVFSGVDAVSIYDLSNQQLEKLDDKATTIAVSADKTVVATVYKDEAFANVYDVASGEKIQTVDFEGKVQSVIVNDRFANPQDNILALNANGSMLGVSFADGSLFVYDLENPDGDVEIYDDTSGFTHFEGGFNNEIFAFAGSNDEHSVFAMIDMENLIQAGAFESTTYFGTVADETGIYVNTANVLVKIEPFTGEQTPIITNSNTVNKYGITENAAVISSEKQVIFFDEFTNKSKEYSKEQTVDFVEVAGNLALVGSLNSPNISVYKFEDCSGEEVFQYNPSEIEVDEARVAADLQTVMFFSYDKFAVYDMDGTLICETDIPNADYVYDQQFRRIDGQSYLEVIYNDGKTYCYSADDGNLIAEFEAEMPDASLYEEFETDNYIIKSTLHEGAAVYNKNDEFVCDLAQDGYLTYVTQVDNYMVTEYISTDGQRYALLLNENCEVIANLPNLTDIFNNELYFNYSSGNIRKCSIYSKEELLEMVND